MTTLLHAHTGEYSNAWHRALHEIILDGLLETLKIIPFLFLTYLFMELIEHRASDKAKRFMERSGAAGPLAGGLLGLIPQCGFSAAAANLFAGRIITVGTLVAVFLSTSDEMLPVLISGSVPLGTVGLVLLYKTCVAIFVGMLVDFVCHLAKKEQEKINIDVICDEDNCHCERGIAFSALHHTATISLFIFLITLAINALIFFVGEDNLGSILFNKPFISHLIASVIGLIPNCAVSVGLTTLCTKGIITAGTMMAGLFSGAGIGLLVLMKINKRLKENLVIAGISLASGVIFGLVADLIFPMQMFI